MSNPIWTNPIKHPEDVGVGVWRRRIPLNTVGLTTGVPVVALEKGSIPLRAYVRIEEAFNAGTTNVLVLGSAADDDGLVTSANAAAGTTGFKAGTGVELGAELAADTIFYGKFTQTGTVATTGIAEFVVEFANPRNWAHYSNRSQGL
jgi:Tfp pilus assembly protein PilW